MTWRKPHWRERPSHPEDNLRPHEAIQGTNSGTHPGEVPAARLKAEAHLCTASYLRPHHGAGGLLETEGLSEVSDDMRKLVEEEWPELVHKLPPRVPQS